IEKPKRRQSAAVQRKGCFLSTNKIKYPLAPSRKREDRMPLRPTRRQFLHTTATTSTTIGLAELGDFAALLPFSPARAADAQVTPARVRFSRDMGPVVRRTERTPQEQCIPTMIEQPRQGLPYRHFVAALYLAAIRAARWHGDGIHGYDHSAYVVH